MTPFSTILVPVDDSEESEGLVRWAANFAREPRLLIHLLYVEPDPLPADVTHLGMVIAHRRHASAAAKKLENWMRLFIPAPSRGQIMVKSGNPAAKILEGARECSPDLIVVSAHHRGALKRLFLGSTTEHLLKAGEFPVLVVPLAALRPA